MSADTGDLRLSMERVAHLIAQDRRSRTVEHFGLLLCRNLCWASAGLSGCIALGLSILRWEGVLIPAAGVIHWFVVGLGLAFLGAVAIQGTISERRTAAGQRRINERMDAAAARLREEIHDARPADHEVIAALVALHEATQELVSRLLRAVSELSVARDDPKVAELSERCQDLESDLASVRLWQKQIHEEFTARLNGKVTDLRPLPHQKN